MSEEKKPPFVVPMEEYWLLCIVVTGSPLPRSSPRLELQATYLIEHQLLEWTGTELRPTSLGIRVATAVGKVRQDGMAVIIPEDALEVPR